MTKQKITLADFAKSPVLKAHAAKSKAVARALGIDLPTVYSRKYKALRKLQRVALCAAA